MEKELGDNIVFDLDFFFFFFFFFGFRGTAMEDPEKKCHHPNWTAHALRNHHGEVTRFVHHGILAAVKSGERLALMNTVSRKAVGRRYFNDGTVFIIRELFSRCSSLDFVELALSTRWNVDLETFFMECCQLVWPKRSQASSNSNGKDRQWRKEVTAKVTQVWPKWILQFDDVPLSQQS